MAQPGAVDIEVPIFGSLVTDRDPVTLPIGASPNCCDCRFLPGGVRTRGGVSQIPNSPTAKLMYLKTYVDPNGFTRNMYLDVNGVLWQEYPQGTFTQIYSGISGGGASPAFCKSVTAFGREYFAFSDGRHGTDLPRQYNGVTGWFDRVTQCAPGFTALGSSVAPTAINIVSTTGRGAILSNNLATINTQTPHGLTPGATVVVASVDDSSFDGTFTVQTVPSGTSFTYPLTGSNTTSENGTVTLRPASTSGTHQVAICFITRNGYITAPSIIGTFSLSSGDYYSVGLHGLLTHVPDTVSDILAIMTAAGSGNFFYTPVMQTSLANFLANGALTFDISDQALMAGNSADYLFELVELGECAGVTSYGNRLAWWGERNKLDNLLNLSFDGGFGILGTVPWGWNEDPTDGTGGSADPNSVFGYAYRITGNGVSVYRGMITQSAVQDSFGNPILQSNVAYSMRVRLLQSGVTQGNWVADVYSPTVGPLGSFTVPYSGMTGNFIEVTGTLINNTSTTIPSDAVFRIYTNGTVTNNGYFTADDIEIYPTGQPYNDSLIRWSYAEEPEAFDSLTGVMQPNPQDGQQVMACGKIRNTFYMAKGPMGSLWSTQDDGTNEPSLWKLQPVSLSVGAVSVHSLGSYEGESGEDWLILLDRNGAFLFDSSGPGKLTSEIQFEATNLGRPNWNSINWEFAYTMWLVIDIRNRRLLIGAPMGSVSSPNLILYMDFKTAGSPSAMEAESPVYVSAYTGRILSKESQRKWCPWSLAANCGALIERNDGKPHTFVGLTAAEFYPASNALSPINWTYSASVAADGGAYEISDSNLYDSIVTNNTTVDWPIMAYHMGAYLPDAGKRMELQQLLTASRVLMSYLTFFAEGNGDMTIFTMLPGDSVQQQIPNSTAPPLALSNPSIRDFETFVNTSGERIALLFCATWPPLNGNTPQNVGDWFLLAKCIAQVQNDPATPWRGFN